MCEFARFLMVFFEVVQFCFFFYLAAADKVTGVEPLTSITVLRWKRCNTTSFLKHEKCGWSGEKVKKWSETRRFASELSAATTIWHQIEVSRTEPGTVVRIFHVKSIFNFSHETMTECSDALNNHPYSKCSGVQVRDRYFTYRLWSTINGSEEPQEDVSHWDTQAGVVCTFCVRCLSHTATGVTLTVTALIKQETGFVKASSSEKDQHSLAADWNVTFFLTKDKTQLQPSLHFSFWEWKK